jgi:hypothetical protein
MPPQSRFPASVWEVNGEYSDEYQIKEQLQQDRSLRTLALARQPHRSVGRHRLPVLADRGLAGIGGTHRWRNFVGRTSSDTAPRDNSRPLPPNRDEGCARPRCECWTTWVPVDVLSLDRARCLLVAGVPRPPAAGEKRTDPELGTFVPSIERHLISRAHRRSRRRRKAREALDGAAAELTSPGAVAFAERAHPELVRIGRRTPAPTAVTTEERVARLAAHRRTNRAIADPLFISPSDDRSNRRTRPRGRDRQRLPGHP